MDLSNTVVSGLRLTMFDYSVRVSGQRKMKKKEGKRGERKKKGFRVYFIKKMTLPPLKKLRRPRSLNSFFLPLLSPFPSTSNVCLPWTMD
jgi:hypothetical protein